MDYKKDMLGKTAAAYLRKSRMEEGMETDEVLHRHREWLKECAQRHGLDIVDYYPEVVSGESLYARPQMLKMLEAVETGQYDAVLCMDLDRLSRGRMKDQGIILDAFRESGTLIVTPDKVYDLADEMDDEMAEFKTFMSRREYKIINKRLRRGLQRSIRDGCYVANAPYGYKKITVDRRPTLEIFEPEARFVRMIFDLYLQGYGCVSIAGQINAMGARPHRSPQFGRGSIAKIIQNPTYIGKIVWDQKTHIKKNTKGNLKHITIYNPREKWTITDGLHPPIIDNQTFERAQEIMKGRYRPSKRDGTIKSPLAGLVQCGNCGGNMQRMTMKGEPYLLCPKKGCCASAKFSLVENAVLDHLGDILKEMKIEPPEQEADTTSLETALCALEKELSLANRQKTRLYELLELGEYDLPTFRERMAAVAGKLADLEARRSEAKQKIEDAKNFDRKERAKNIQNVLDVYRSSEPPVQNALLHSVISSIRYYKEKKSKPSAFNLVYHLK